MLELNDVCVSIKRTRILQDVALHIPNGSIVGLIGRNGAGKTTLMRTVMGFLPAEKGEVRFQDRSLTRLTAHSRARLGIGYMPEDRKLVPTLTVEENILLSFWATKNDKLPRRLPWVYEMIPEVTEFSGRKAMELSGGQQKLVALARALFCGTKLLLLDEPFEGVAPALAQRLAEVVANLKEHDQSVLLSESDHVHSSELLDRLYVIERGEVKEK
ncbi:MAG: ATP-binding cassette domain-containing protein [Desulfobacterales bacterium]|nr:ATP-binding cassette domain-containing protein [Desulfobacterales bacterium]